MKEMCRRKRKRQRKRGSLIRRGRKGSRVFGSLLEKYERVRSFN